MMRKINTKRRKTAVSKTNVASTELPKAETKAGNNTQTFSLTAPAAMNVQLVGNFTQWHEKPIALQKDADGVWRTIVELPAGAHHYRFLVDGQWSDDPGCTLRVPNPFGGEDMVRQVA